MDINMTNNAPITTTLNKIAAHKPCKDGWKKLLTSLGKTKPDDEPLKFSAILASNGLDDTLWCLRSICPEHDREVRLFAADCAESVLHIFERAHPDDKRPRLAIEAARDFANGKIDDATRVAAGAAGAAAWAAAGAAARDAAGDAAWAAAGDAAWAAAGAAARDAAGAAAWAAAGAAQDKLLTERFS